MATKYIKKAVDEWLRELDYQFMGYMPTDEALLFVNFIKEVNNGAEENETPLVHLKMMDNVFNKEKRCAILCHRGVGKSLSLDSVLYTDNGPSNIADIKVGDTILGEDGEFTTVTYKSEVFHTPMYEISLADGRQIKVSEDHINSVIHQRQKRINGKRVSYLDRRDITTQDLFNLPLVATRSKTTKNPKGKENRLWFPLPKPVNYTEKEFPVDPYTLGVLLGDGSIARDTGYARLHCHKDDAPHYKKNMPYQTGTVFIDKRNTNVLTFGVLKLGKILKKLQCNVHGNYKVIPEQYLYGSIEQRTALLMGLMDTDGTCSSNGGVSFCSNSIGLAKGVQTLVWSLGGMATLKPKKKSYQVCIQINIPVFSLARKLDRQHFRCFSRVPVTSIHKIPTEPSQCIAVDNASHTFLTSNYTVTHNTTVFAEYLILFVAAFGIFPGFGAVNLILYVTDSIENGVKNLRRNIEYRFNESEFLQKLIPDQRITVGTDGVGFVGTEDYEKQIAAGRKFTDIRLEFRNHKGHILIVKGYGAKALALDSILYTQDGTTTIGECGVGDQIFGADGVLTTITHKSEVFHKPMYELCLADGRSIKVSEDHINPVVINTNPNNYVRWEERNLTTTELLQESLRHTKIGNKRHSGTSSKALVFVKNILPIQYPTKDLPVDPYTLGVVLGDGRIQKPSCSVELTTHITDLPTYQQYIPYEFGKGRFDKRNPHTWTQSIRGMGPALKKLKLGVHGNHKFIPEIYFYGSIEQRVALLQGLMDTDGTVTKTGRTSFCSTSPQLLADVIRLARSLGATASTNKKAFNAEIWLNHPLFRLPRKLVRQRYDRRSAMVAVTAIRPIADEPSQCIAVDNDEHQFIVGEYVRTHNTGVRGAKELGKRPTVAILDDLVSDTDAESSTVINTIENTVYKAVSKALHPTRQKMIWLGTPFNARDPLYKAVESGAWQVSVFPICEHFPCSREEFRGSWEDRFPYDYVLDEYNEAQALGKPENFNQELMLKIMSDEDRLIKDEDIMWFRRSTVMKNRAAFNFYITTDFATSEQEASDYAVISVWALNHKGYWYWMDGICAKQDMGQNIKDLFRLAQEWNPQSVGIEVSGQQGGFIPWINEKMVDKNIYFNIASEGNKGKQGIRPNTNKMVRFNTILPKFKSKEIFFPIELKDEPPMLECMNELTLASKGGFKSKKDDFIDNISQLSSLMVWRPSEVLSDSKNVDGIYEYEEEEESSVMDSYIV